MRVESRYIMGDRSAHWYAWAARVMAHISDANTYVQFAAPRVESRAISAYPTPESALPTVMCLGRGCGSRESAARIMSDISGTQIPLPVMRMLMVLVRRGIGGLAAHPVSWCECRRSCRRHVGGAGGCGDARAR